MKRILPIEGVTIAKRVLALVSCTVALASLTLVPAAAQAPTEEQLRALEAQVLVLVNQARAQEGLPPFTVSPQLSDAARRHSLDMATNNFAGPNGSDGSTPTTRIQDTGYRRSSLGESFFAGVTTAEEALKAAGAKILGGYAEIGVAVEYNANSDYGYYWTMDFGGVRPPTEAQLRALEARVLDLVNQEREKVGASPLAWSDELAYAARRHSQDMATHNFFSHTGSDGSTPGTRIQDTGYQGSSLGENIAASFTSAEEAMNAWMNSPVHRANILGGYAEIGVAVEFSANSDAGYYWTQAFGRR